MIKKTSLLLTVALLLTLSQAAAENNTTDKKIIHPVGQSIDIRQDTQQAQEKWRAEQEKLIAKYDQLQSEQTRLEEHHVQLQEYVAAARNRVALKEKQLADIEQISSKIGPFCDDVIQALDQLLSQGTPFLIQERQRRVDSLKRLMGDPAVSTSEKYRKVMEALLIEAEYGFTIEAYQETIAIGGQSILADIFRLGRISLFFQSLDRQQCGFYNPAQHLWQPLPPSFNPQIQSAIDIAAKRKPVELLALPLGRMVTQ